MHTSTSPSEERKTSDYTKNFGGGEWKSGYLILRYESKENLENLS